MPLPSTQEAALRPISFTLLVDGRVDRFANLYIRPEELTRQDPSRITVLQTLGGAFADDFGRGLATITITGHTGWRGGEQRDGVGEFLLLRETVFERWHKLRAEQRTAGGNRGPDSVELIFADELNRYAVTVIPGQFQLRRSKSRPLLCYYNLQMTVLSDAGDKRGRTTAQLLRLDEDVQAEATLEAVRASLAAASAYQVDFGNRLPGTVGPQGAELGGLVATTGRLLDRILDASQTIAAASINLTDQAIGLVNETTGPLIALATEAQQAARNIGTALAAPLAISQEAALALNAINGALLDGYCTLVNHVNDVRYYFDLSDFYGASSCSSTTGGRPISPIRGVNPFALMFPGNAPEVLRSPQAADAVRFAAGADPLDLAQYSTADLRAMARAITDGLPA